MTGSFLFTVTMLAIFIIVLTFWGWRVMKGTAGRPVGWVAILLTILVLSFIAPWLWQKINDSRIAIKSSGVQTTRPSEEWIFTWTLPPGQTDNGRNRHTLEVEITKNDGDSLWAILHDRGNGEDVKVGGLRLAKNGDNLIGTWNNYLDGDGGKCYLYKEGTSHWSGHYELKNESHTDCTLKLK